MTLHDKVSHKGQIVSIDKNTIGVLITSVSACANCSSQKACMVAEKEEKKISVHVNNTSAFSVGEEVNVSLQQSTGLKAVWWAYLFPFLLIVLSLFLGIFLLLKDGFIALIAFVSIAVYYIILYKFRNVLSKKFEFTISKLDDFCE